VSDEMPTYGRVLQEVRKGVKFFEIHCEQGSSVRVICRDVEECDVVWVLQALRRAGPRRPWLHESRRVETVALL